MGKYRDTKSGLVYEADSTDSLPAGSYVQVNQATPASPGCSCTPCSAGSGYSPAGDAVGVGMRTDSQAICDLPAAEPINASFTPCLKPIFVDCFFALWTTDPYSGLVFCRSTDDAWQAAKLDRCPAISSNLYFEPTSETWWALINDTYYKYGVEGWAQYTGTVPTCLSKVYWNASTGDYVYYRSVSETGQREVIDTVPFCSGTVA